MECSICFEDINATTGSTTLSCSHSFHIHCLFTWLAKQTSESNQQTCPFCRHEMTALERGPDLEPPQEEDDDVSDSDSSSTNDAEEGRVRLTRHQFNLFLSAVGAPRRYTWLQWMATCGKFHHHTIIFRRSIMNGWLEENELYHKLSPGEWQQLLSSHLAPYRFHGVYTPNELLDLEAAEERARHTMRKKLEDLGEDAFKHYAASRFNACVRGFFDRQLTKQLATDINYAITFERKQKRYVLCQRFYRNWIGLSLPQRRSFCATKIQSVVRMHYARKVLERLRKEVEKEMLTSLKVRVSYVNSGGRWKRTIVPANPPTQPPPIHMAQSPIMPSQSRSPFDNLNTVFREFLKQKRYTPGLLALADAAEFVTPMDN
jgi:hypothetical protein